MVLGSLLNQPEFVQILVAAISAISALLGVAISQIIQAVNNKSRYKHELNLKQIESVIKKQDNIQGLQLQALKEFWKIYHGLLPSAWPHPNFEREDALCDVLQNMSYLIEQLNSYSREFGYILPNQVNEKINNIIYQCNSSHWGISTSDGPDYEPSSQEIESASEVLKELSDAVSLFKAYLDVTKLDHPISTLLD